ncbi:TPA: hypothetical protein ACH3X2_011321 [Trebouxia sp. C0005]
MAAMCTDGADLDHQVADPVHMHLLSLGVVDDMCKGKKPASESGMQYACWLNMDSHDSKGASDDWTKSHDQSLWFQKLP